MIRRVLLGLAVGAAVGLILALDAGRQPGYVAGYSAAVALILTGVAVLVAIALLCFTRTRLAGAIVFLAALAGYLTFAASMTILDRRGTWDKPAIQVTPSATPSQRADRRARIDRAPTVYAVFENLSIDRSLPSKLSAADVPDSCSGPTDCASCEPPYSATNSVSTKRASGSSH